MINVKNFQDSMNSVTKRIILDEEQLVKLSNVLNPLILKEGISKELLDKTCIEIKAPNANFQVVINFISNTTFECTCFINGIPLSILLVENILRSDEEFKKKYPDYKAIGDTNQLKSFPITLVWFNDNIKSINLDSHAIYVISIAVNISNFLAVKENFISKVTTTRKIYIDSNSPLIGNRQTRRKNKKNGISGSQFILQKLLIITLPESDTIEKIIMKHYNIKKRVVKAHTRTLKNGVIKKYPQRTYYRLA